jgi:hypothetical protein
MDVAIGDGSGHVARLGSRTRYALPGDRGLSKLWAQTVRLKLPQRSAIDLSDVEWIRFVGDSRQGRVVVLDAFGRSPGVSNAPRPTLPRVDVHDVSIKEGDNGKHFEQVSLDVTGQVSGGERLYVQSSDRRRNSASGQQIFRLSPGQTSIQIPVAVSGDTRDDYRLQSEITVKALSGIFTGDYSGNITTRDDDPAPNVVIDQPTQATSEGDPLRWTIHLDGPSDKGISLRVKPIASGDSELTLSDLPREFVRHHIRGSFFGDTKLSNSGLRFDEYLRPRHLDTQFVLPVRIDDLAEGAETVTLRSTNRSDRPLPNQLLGTVNDVAP